MGFNKVHFSSEKQVPIGQEVPEAKLKDLGNGDFEIINKDEFIEKYQTRNLNTMPGDAFSSLNGGIYTLPNGMTVDSANLPDGTHKYGEYELTINRAQNFSSVTKPATKRKGSMGFSTPNVNFGECLRTPIIDEEKYITVKITKEKCNHEWVTYNSLFGKHSSFEYCKHCDVRKDEA